MIGFVCDSIKRVWGGENIIGGKAASDGRVIGIIIVYWAEGAGVKLLGYLFDK